MFKRTDHLTDQELLCFIDGETSHGIADRTRKHLDACADCRSRQLALEGAAAKFAEFHHATLDPKLTSAPQPHAILKAKLNGQQPAPKSSLGRFSLRTPVYLYAAIATVALSITALDRHALFSKVRSLPPQLESRLLPDSGLTPGVTRPVGLADICLQEQEADDLDPAVSPSIKKVVFQEYGIDEAPSADFQVDYLINPQLGGTADVRNLWPEPYGSKVWNARLKDALEDRLHVMVCNRQIDLASAQREIATDWIAAYKKYVHKSDPA
jgi:hypothetical protein